MRFAVVTVPADLRSRLAVLQQVTRAGILEADCEMAAGAGYEGIGLSWETVAERGPDAVSAVLEAAGLEASSVVGIGQTSTSTEPDVAGERVRPVLDAAATIGAPGVLTPTGPLAGRTVEEADAQSRRWLEAVGPVAEDAGVILMIEPVHPLMRSVSYVHTLDHALDLVAGIPGTGVVLDLGHLWWDRTLPERIATHAERIATVQVTDVAVPDMADLRYERTQLGEGDVPLGPLVTTLEQSGYRGWYENELILRMPRSERPAFLAETARRFRSL